MVQYLLRRLGQAVLAMIGTLIITFFIVRLVPGDPIRAQLGPTATPGAIAYWRNFYALNESLPQQFVKYLQELATLNLGTSIQWRQPVTTVVFNAIGPSLVLIAYAVILSIAVAVPLAIFSALYANRMPDNVVRVVTMLTYGMPGFWLATMLILVFASGLKWFPTTGVSGEGFGGLLWSLTLPAVTIALGQSVVLLRNLRSSIIESLGSEYVEAARARGLSGGRVIVRYVLRNSLLSTITVLGLSLGLLIGSTVVIENVFSIPGLGSRTVLAVATRDFPMIQICVLVIGAFVILANLAADFVNVVLDPRIRVKS